MLRSSRLVLSAVLVLLCAGCDTATDPLATVPLEDGSRTTIQTFQSVQTSGAVDVRFYAPALRPGERVSVAAGSVRLQSTARTDGHQDLSWSAPDRSFRRVIGLLAGEIQASFDLEAAEDAGSTDEIPTSVHIRKFCRGNVCTEQTEYDYDLTSPDGTGVARWTPPGGEAVTVDRIRFEVSGDASPLRAVVVSSPETLRLAPATGPTRAR